MVFTFLVLLSSIVRLLYNEERGHESSMALTVVQEQRDTGSMVFRFVQQAWNEHLYGGRNKDTELLSSHRSEVDKRCSQSAVEAYIPAVAELSRTPPPEPSPRLEEGQKSRLA